jgi:hypothetical protein
VMPSYDSSSASESARGGDHGTTGPVFSARALPPASMAKAVSAASASGSPCSAVVTPGLPWEGALGGHQHERPEAVRRTAEREVRASSCVGV